MTARRDEHGAVALFTALTVVVLCIFAALAVDIGNTWARRGQLQVQADRAAAYAAQSLPARTNAAKLRVAKAVAFYLACHPVNGQRDLNPDLPACPDTPESPTLSAYATKLLDAEMVTFPAGNEVHVVTPQARVGFAFGELVGTSGTIQRKQATAKVTSPGMLSPMALSLDCLLNFGANLTGGLGLPFGYISTTHKGSGPAPVTTSWPPTTQDAPKSIGISPDGAPWALLGLGGGPAARVTAMNWPELKAGESYVVHFARGSGLARKAAVATGDLVLTNTRPNRRTGYMDIVVPADVVATAGQWQVKIAVKKGSVETYSSATATFEVTLDLSLPDVACGRLLKSPREGTNANANFALNLQHGIDHLIEQYPTIVGTGGLTRDDLLNIANLTQCASSDPRTVKDTNGGGGTPNCVITKMSNAYEAGFTEGMIGPQGRLTCTTAHPCRPGKSFPLNGVQVNNDQFTDFVRSRSLLTSSTFFNLDTYLTTGIPVVTPTSNLDRSIYDSHRFMWVAVLSTAGATSAVQAGDYPVLTFRPIFVTQETALDELPLLGSVANTVVRMLNDALLPLISGTNDQNGLMMDSNGKLSAIRFLTISPDALPAVPAEYTGPESEYLGVGPRIIRLVQ